VRVRDVEIALVLAREMKAAAERQVEASLRLEQLQEVFGAEALDQPDRARIQTALQMAGLEPQPSLLEADPGEPIRFVVQGTAAPAAAPAPAEEAVEQRQEFPTVGEFARSAFSRFRRRRGAEGGNGVTTATEEPAAGGPPPPAEAETAVHSTLPEPEALDHPDPELEEPVEQDAEVASANGHVETPTNGHAHLDFDGAGLLDDVVLPPHETATPADFGASAETVDFDDPRVEEELAHVPEPEPEPLPVPEPLAYVEPEPGTAPQPAHAEAPEQPVLARPSLLFAAVAVPVVIASFAGWAFGLAFVALGLIATGLLRHARLSTVLKAGAAVTVASLGVSILLAGLDSGDSDPSDQQPAAEEREAEPPRAEESPAAQEPETEAEEPARERDEPARGEASERDQGPPPDEETEGLIRVPQGAERSDGSQGTAPVEPGAGETAPGATAPPVTEPQP
jgi:hypothetical protein